ncbi:MAG: protein translocase subunit SecD [Chromatiales bacterium]|jgi:preprotein translocase subunit SecD|nr:protein translocase subunit SecD [Chromatiales bacterium]
MNRYPWWKNLIVIAVVLIGLLYAAPNIYGQAPVVQVSALRGAALDDALRSRVSDILRQGSVASTAIEKEQAGLVLKFADTDAQLRAQDLLATGLGDDYVVALNLVSDAPAWFRAFNALPMYLGLDLRGGVHFLMEVDLDAAVAQAEERYVNDIRTLLRDERIRYVSAGRAPSGGIEIVFRGTEDRAAARPRIARQLPGLVMEEVTRGDTQVLLGNFSADVLRETRSFAVEQNVTTLRNRVNELGVAEPVIQRQGQRNIVIQLPGVQDPARAKEILGATATLEFRMVDQSGDVQAALAGHVPATSRLYRQRNGTPQLLDRRVIVTGDQISGAASGFDSQSGSPTVSVSLDSAGGRRMLQTTRDNIGRPMAVVFIERKPQTRTINGETVRSTRVVEEIINIATIRGQFGNQFQITGLDSSAEAHDLALLLRAGALAAPIEIVEERTIGPSLGQDNIDQGIRSVIVGFIFIMVFMTWRYRLFGVVANLALFLNLVLLIAMLSLIQATLTLPGIAGIALTVGMAVDANVLICERIREELRNGSSPQASIVAGYDKAWATILDSNLTTLIVALALMVFGAGPVRGFAITLGIGILSSMFTAVMVTRAVTNLIYGGRKVQRLSI